MILSTLQSWAVLLLALGLPVAIVRILWLLAHPLKMCSYCDAGYRGTSLYVPDAGCRAVHACCSTECVGHLTESIWRDEATP